MNEKLPWETASAEEIENDLRETAARVYEIGLGRSPVLFDKLHPETEPKRPCYRGPEECDGFAYEEMDGTLAYWACEKCGYEWGYQQTAADDPSCQLGIPEDVRRITSGEPKPKVIPLTIRRNDEDL